MAVISATGVPVGTRSWLSHARGVIALVILTPFTVAAAASGPYWHPTPAVELAWWGLGWASFVAGAALRLWATLYIGGRKGRDIATEGPYSLCRHPLYLGSFLLALSIGLFIGSLTFTVGLILASLVFYSVTVPAEERRLLERHGAVYADFRRRVPAFFPRLRWPETSPNVDVDIRCLAIEARRALRWAIIPLACQMFLWLRDTGGWPEWWTLP